MKGSSASPRNSSPLPNLSTYQSKYSKLLLIGLICPQLAADGEFTHKVELEIARDRVTFGDYSLMKREIGYT